MTINKTLALTLKGIFDSTQEKLGRIDLPVFYNPVTEKAYEDVDRAFAGLSRGLELLIFIFTISGILLHLISLWSVLILQL